MAPHSASFDGFPADGLDFLRNLPGRDKTWFDANRKTYTATVADPAKAFVKAMGAALADRISPAIEAQPKTNGSIAPINNDLRFSPDATPYKDHLMFRFWEGSDKKSAAMLMVRVHPDDGVGFSTGAGLADLDRWRELIDGEPGADLAAAVDHVVKATGADVVGEGLKRVPKPYPADHPRADLLRHKGLQVRWIPDDHPDLTEPSIVDWCADQLTIGADVHRWLVDNLA